MNTTNPGVLPSNAAAANIAPALPTHNLQHLRIAITGGTSGLGLALLQALHARGAQVAFVARHAGRVAEVARRHAGVHGIVGDVSAKADIHPIALQINAALGGLDVLVNNASSLGPVPLALLADTECEDFEQAVQTNLLGPFRLTQALLGSLVASARDRRGALVVNIGSDAAVTPYATWGAYGASKAALQHLSRIWDEELQPHGVRLLAIDPGDMDTPMHALALPGLTADERAALKSPAQAARELLAVIESRLAQRAAANTQPLAAAGDGARIDVVNA
jgi:NAD(P)-dependent dehydrogenase (short-subunit alcohol dehydrogenase family)